MKSGVGPAPAPFRKIRNGVDPVVALLSVQDRTRLFVEAGTAEASAGATGRVVVVSKFDPTETPAELRAKTR
jgi:hypothetical protein